MTGGGSERPVADAAAEVRAFYERHPYPAPATDLGPYRELWSDAERRRAAFHLLWPSEPYRADLSVLVAGCGTSQAAKHAIREPSSRVTAVDVSEASLRHTQELKTRHGLDNLETHRLPLERVGELGLAFDKVVCTGVLHHLPDPDEGLRALRGVLAPGGAMHLMVYAAYGRAGVYMLQEYCRLLDVRASDQDLKDLATMLGRLPNGHPLTTLLGQARDFRRPAALADALLHPRDRAYTVPELYAWLERCGMAFCRWYHQAPYLARCGVVAESPHAERLAALPPPSQHAALELFRGTIVKHELVAYRDDRTGQAWPVRFDDEGWLDYVPHRLPSTIAVRDRGRLPPGAVAVLINRAHSQTDLFLPVDAEADRLMAAVDGTRRVREILEIARVSAEPEARQRAGCFFEHLWSYDQVVFELPR